MRKEPYKVVVWGPGTVGNACLRQLLSTPGFEVVGVLGYSPQKDGSDIGELLGMPTAGVQVTTSKEAIYDLTADVVLHSPRFTVDLSETDQDVVKLLSSGKNVISATSYQYPFRHGADYVRMLQEACKRGNASLMGTGVHPGYIGEVLATTLSGLCNSIEQLTIREFVDLSHSRSAQGLQMIGYGRDPADVEKTRNPVFGALERYWGDTLSYLARVMFDADARIEHVTTFIPAEEEIVIPVMTIPKGNIAAIRHVLRAYVDDVLRFEIDEYLYHTAAAKPFDYIDAGDFYEIEIEGKPSSVRTRMALKASLARDLDFWPDDPTPQAWYATATPMVQAIPGVVRAAAGLMLPEVARHFHSDILNYKAAAEVVRQELQRLGVEP
jgi:hypothetical protein